MVSFCFIYTAQRRWRPYVLVKASTFPLFWVKHKPSSTDISKYFYKRNNNKKYYYIKLNLFFLCWLACFKFVQNKNAQVFCIGLTLFWQLYTSKHVILSFYTECFNVVAFFCCVFCCLQWTPTVIYLYLVWVINWQPVWLEYCWHSVNFDTQTLDASVLRKKNYSLFLECTFDRSE